MTHFKTLCECDKVDTLIRYLDSTEKSGIDTFYDCDNKRIEYRNNHTLNVYDSKHSNVLVESLNIDYTCIDNHCLNFISHIGLLDIIVSIPYHDIDNAGILLDGDYY